MPNSTEKTENRIITAGVFAASSFVGYVAIRHIQRQDRRWFSRSKREPEIRIDSGKEGIQPKSNIKPKFLQVTG